MLPAVGGIVCRLFARRRAHATRFLLPHADLLISVFRGLSCELCGGAGCVSVTGMRPADESVVVDVHVHFH